MGDAFLMRRGQAVGDLPGVVDRFARGERAFAKTVAQSFTFQQLGDYIWSCAVFADIEDGENVGVIERGRGAAFQREALQAIRIGELGKPTQISQARGPNHSR